MSSKRLPTVYVPHGGGPWPFVELSLVQPGEAEKLSEYLQGIPHGLPAPPTAVLVISAHWEENVPTVMNGAHPPMLYDYYGFPEAAYHITWPAPGEPNLANRVRELLHGARFQTRENGARGFDHGTFVPLKVAFPKADVPTVQLSLLKSLDPAEHIALGRALAPLRDEGVLIVGSGMSYHDLRGFFRSRGRAVSEVFDAWLASAATAEPASRTQRLIDWDSAPVARQAHPREEHLLPLLVAVGAAEQDPGKVTFRGTFGGVVISGYQFG